jgi:hypothetical protein
MSSSEEESHEPVKQIKKKTEKRDNEHIFKYITLEKAQASIAAASYEIKKNEHGKDFVLFYDEDDTMIEERSARQQHSAKGKKNYVCLDKKFDEDFTPDNDFTRAFSPDIKKVLKDYQAKTYIMNTNTFTHTAKNSEKYRVEYLDSDGNIIKRSFALKCKNNSYTKPWKVYYKLPSSN